MFSALYSSLSLFYAPIIVYLPKTENSNQKGFHLNPSKYFILVLRHTLSNMCSLLNFYFSYKKDLSTLASNRVRITCKISYDSRSTLTCKNFVLIILHLKLFLQYGLVTPYQPDVVMPLYIVLISN